MQIKCPHCNKENRFPVYRLGSAPKCGACHKGLISGPIVLNQANIDELLVQKILPVLIDFWAPWCGPCRSVAPEVEQLARLTAGEAVVTKVNTEALPELASQLRIQSIPTFVVLRRGVETARTSGAMPASRLRDFIRQSIR